MLKSRMNVILDILELSAKEVIVQLDKETEERDWGIVQFSRCMRSEQPGWGLGKPRLLSGVLLET